MAHHFSFSGYPPFPNGSAWPHVATSGPSHPFSGQSMSELEVAEVELLVQHGGRFHNLGHMIPGIPEPVVLTRQPGPKTKRVPSLEEGDMPRYSQIMQGTDKMARFALSGPSLQAKLEPKCPEYKENEQICRQVLQLVTSNAHPIEIRKMQRPLARIPKDQFAQLCALFSAPEQSVLKNYRRKGQVRV